jgi:hypothetical protein
MSASFIRRFTFDPGDTVLLNIESVNILDLNPPGAIAGVGAGVVLLVGEFENGPFNTPTQVANSVDLQNHWGTLGFTYGSIPANFPCAVQRSPDAAITPEPWNGNGFVALNGKQFASLLVCRADTSVGSVAFTRLAYLTGNALFTYPLHTGTILALDVGAGPTSATFTGVAAVVTAVGGVYPTTFTGVESLTLGYDGVPNFTVFFQAADQTELQVIARINQFAGFAFATNSAGQIRLTGIQAGTGGQVRVVAASPNSVLTQLGLTVGNTAGTGNVANIAAVTFQEVDTIVELAIANTLVEQDSSGALRISNVGTPGTGTITVTAATTADAVNVLGFAVGATNSAATGVAGTLPAGTVVGNAALSQLFVTMQDVTVTAASAGPYNVKVRPAPDDGTGTVLNAGLAVVVRDAPDLGAFSVTNGSPLGAALTEAQLDAAYVNAINATTGINGIAKTTNIIWAARHSNAVRRALRSNALFASANGCQGRMACVSPPLNTPPSIAQSVVADPGVGAYRSERVVYCYVGANVFVPLIAQRGLAGGTGFTATGNVDVTSDGWMASILSQLPPEENPGQDTPFTSAINGIELGANVQGFSMANYQTFKSLGIAALRMDTDNGIAIFQSGVTSVDPLVNAGLVRIARRRMADYIQDSIAVFTSGFGKKLGTFRRKKAIAGAINSFLGTLLGANNPGSQRIDGYTPAKDVTTPDESGLGLFRLLVLVRTLTSLDSIVIATQIGDTVVVTTSLPAAA